MKQNDIVNLDKLLPQQLENLFNIFTTDDGSETYYYNILKTANFPADLDESIYFNYTVKPQDSYPLISYKIYGDVQLWWLICAVNNISNPLPMPKSGTILKIITTDIVKTILSDIRDT